MICIKYCLWVKLINKGGVLLKNINNFALDTKNFAIISTSHEKRTEILQKGDKNAKK